MAINLNAFNQNAPQIDLANSFRQGVAAVGDVYGAKRQKQALIADQFANQQAPILAQQKAQAFEQDLLNSEATRSNIADQMKFRDLENKQKTADYIGNVFTAVQRPEDLEIAFQHVANHPALDKDVLTHSLNFFKDPSRRTVEAAQQFGQGTIKAVEQAQLRFNAIKEQQNASEAEKRLTQQAVREQGVQNRFEESQRSSEERLNKTLASQENRAIASQERQIEKEEKQAKKYDLSTAFTIRKEYQPKLAAFEEVKKNYEQLKGLGSQNNPKAQMAMIYSFMKILDPESTVRESEYASVTQASSVLNKMGIYTEKLESGKLLSKKDVQEILSAVAPVYVYAQKKQQAEQANYSSLMKENGIDPKTVQLKFYNFGKQPEGKKEAINFGLTPQQQAEFDKLGGKKK